MPDVNYYSIADRNDEEVASCVLPGTGENPLDYSDILKLSKATNIVVKGCTIHGGKEDCIDMNRYCENILVEDTKVISNGNYCFTIKGGTKNVTLRNVVIEKHGKWYDIDLGNWSDQSNELTTGIVLDNVTSADGKPVSVRVLWAEEPTVIGGNVKVITIPKSLYSIYRWLRARKLVP